MIPSRLRPAALKDSCVVPVNGKEMLFSEKYACPDCGISLPALTPRMFSFNSPYGACPDCNGLGSCMHFTEYLVVPDAGLSLREGAIAPWAGRYSLHYHSILDALATHYGSILIRLLINCRKRLKRFFFTDQARRILNFIMIVRIKDTSLTSLLKERSNNWNAVGEKLLR